MSLNARSGPRYKPLAEAGAPYETIRLDKLTPIIGAEISGVDLASPGNRHASGGHVSRVPRHRGRNRPRREETPRCP